MVNNPRLHQSPDPEQPPNSQGVAESELREKVQLNRVTASGHVAPFSRGHPLFMTLSEAAMQAAVAQSSSQENQYNPRYLEQEHTPPSNLPSKLQFQNSARS